MECGKGSFKTDDGQCKPCPDDYYDAGDTAVVCVACLTGSQVNTNKTGCGECYNIADMSSECK